jgi:hypothetical protein
MTDPKAEGLARRGRRTNLGTVHRGITPLTSSGPPRAAGKTRELHQELMAPRLWTAVKPFAVSSRFASPLRCPLWQ